MVKYKQIMQVSLCGNIERDAFNVVTVNGGDAMNMIGRCLRTEGIERGKIRTARNVVSIAKKAPALEIENADDFIAWATLDHEEFIRQKAPEINKVAVRDAIKAGEELPGAKLVAGYRLAVR